MQKNKTDFIINFRKLYPSTKQYRYHTKYYEMLKVDYIYIYKYVMASLYA
jgi:hypothetical protein